MSVVTRFAPSPTGFLHIGGARTALFNWLFARHHGGRYLLRIEDTDRARSTEAAIQAILDGLGWLGLVGDELPVFQSQRSERHAEVARALLKRGAAYRCYCTPDELQAMRAQARAEGRWTGYDGRWRERDPAAAPAGIAPAVRLKAPRTGETLVPDRVQGEVRFDNAQLDDMVLLRADGTPTYMLSVVVDDHDMGVTHVIRGDDHLVNAARQTQIYRALDSRVPVFAHIPLIHGADGAKPSKRHGALGVDAYRAMGFLPEALRNYLLRLGWSHGDEEIIWPPSRRSPGSISTRSAGSPARFDMARLTSLNAHYLRQTDDATLPAWSCRTWRRRATRSMAPVSPASRPGWRGSSRARPPWSISPSAPHSTWRGGRWCRATRRPGCSIGPRASASPGLLPVLAGLPAWDAAALELAVRAYAEERHLKLGLIAQPLRAALTGSDASPGIFDVMVVLGREEVLGRIADAADTAMQHAD